MHAENQGTAPPSWKLPPSLPFFLTPPLRQSAPLLRLLPLSGHNHTFFLLQVLDHSHASQRSVNLTVLDLCLVDDGDHPAKEANFGDIWP